MLLRIAWLLAVTATLAVAGCATRPAAEPPTPPVSAPPSAPTATRGEFTLEADKLDTWNAVGQILVNTPGVEYEGRSQMLDLYTVRYRGESFLILTRALHLSGDITRTTTRVTATTREGRPVDSDAVAELLGLLQRQLPEKIEWVRQAQAEEAAAKRTKAKAAKRKK